MTINEQLQGISAKYEEAMAAADTMQQLEAIRVEMLGKKGELTAVLRSMKDFSPEERPMVGAKVNEARERLTAIWEEKKTELAGDEQNKRLEEERIDVTEPGRVQPIGKLHPLTQTMMEIRDIFVGMGFEIKEGPEIEWSKYNFDMLNIPKTHPSRDMQDSFYVQDDIVLRTHTSPVQVRTMLEQKPPIRMICPGRVFRSDDVDATHSPIFNQIEGLVIDKNVTMGDLIGVLEVFVKEFYGSKTRVKLRPSYFPFTEPSTEVDISCTVCGGKGCRVCKHTGWIELLGSGMVHPNVFRMCGIDPEEYSGFAFGFGLDRITNMRYGITDIRLLYENDLRFLQEF